MRFCIFPVQGAVFLCIILFRAFILSRSCAFPDKKRQVVFIDPLFFIVTVIPYKTAWSAVLCNSTVAHHFPVLILCIKIKKKDSSGIKVIIYQAEHPGKLLRLCDIIHGVAHAYHCPYRAVQLKFPHILKKIEDIMA